MFQEKAGSNSPDHMSLCSEWCSGESWTGLHCIRDSGLWPLEVSKEGIGAGVTQQL